MRSVEWDLCKTEATRKILGKDYTHSYVHQITQVIKLGYGENPVK